MMKKFFLTFLMVVLCCMAAIAQIKVNQESFRDLNAANISGGDYDLGSTNLIARSIEWPTDADGNDAVSLIIVSFQNVPAVEIPNIKPTLSNAIPAAVETRTLDNGNTVMMLFVPAKKGLDVTFTHPRYGATRLVNKNFLDHHVYVLNVENSKLVNIVVNSDPEGAQIYLDGVYKANTPATITDVTLGRHEIQLTTRNTAIADNLPKRMIEVSEAQLNFDFNLRKTTTVTFKADPSGARLKISKDGKIFAQGTGSVTANLPYGEYVISGDMGTAHIDDPVSIGSATPSVINVRVLGSKIMTFNATQNNRNVSGAQVNIDGAQVGTTPLTYRMSYGPHKVQISYYGYITKEKKFNVNADSDSEILLKLPNRHRERHNVFDIDYNKKDWGIAFNYINRHYKFKVNNRSQKFNMWGDENKNDNGMQIGLSYHPYFGYGQGLVTGVYWQYFLGSFETDSYDKVNWSDHAIYIPLQYQFRLPLKENFSIFVNGGIACSIGLSNSFKFDDDDENYNVGYGETEDGFYMPKRVQFSVPVGGGIQFGAFALEGKYSFGLTDNDDLYTVGDDTNPSRVSYKQYTWQVGLTIVF